MNFSIFIFQTQISTVRKPLFPALYNQTMRPGLEITISWEDI